MKINYFSILKLIRQGIILIFSDKKITDLYPFQVAKKILPKRSKNYVSVDLYRCTLCSTCVENCPSNAISINKETNSLTIDYRKCMFCSNCINVCDKHALAYIDKFESANSNKNIFIHSFYVKKGNKIS